MAQFDDGKEDGALRTIGEVSEALDIKPHVLRYWEQQFSLLKPLKRSGGRRYYRPSDISLVQTIDRLVNEEGYTLKGAEAVLRAEGKSSQDRNGLGDPPVEAESEHDERGARKLAETLSGLKRIRERLTRALDA